MAIIMTPPPLPPEGDPASDVPATFTVTYYQQLAIHFSQIIDEIDAIIPNTLSVQKSKTHLNVPMKFLGTAVASVIEVPTLRSTEKLDVNRGQDSLQFLEAFRPIRDKATAFLANLSSALNARHTSLAKESLEVYHAAQALARDESNPTLTAWVGNLKRDLGRRGSKAKRPAPVPGAASVSTTALPPEKPKGGKG